VSSFADILADGMVEFRADVTSGRRPGAKVRGRGKTSYHASGNAADLQIGGGDQAAHETLAEYYRLRGLHALVEAPGSKYASPGNKGFVVHVENRATLKRTVPITLAASLREKPPAPVTTAAKGKGGIPRLGAKTLALIEKDMLAHPEIEDTEMMVQWRRDNPKWNGSSIDVAVREVAARNKKRLAVLREQAKTPEGHVGALRRFAAETVNRELPGEIVRDLSEATAGVRGAIAGAEAPPTAKAAAPEGVSGVSAYPAGWGGQVVDAPMPRKGFLSAPDIVEWGRKLEAWAYGYEVPEELSAWERTKAIPSEFARGIQFLIASGVLPNAAPSDYHRAANAMALDLPNFIAQFALMHQVAGGAPGRSFVGAVAPRIELAGAKVAEAVSRRAGAFAGRAAEGVVVTAPALMAEFSALRVVTDEPTPSAAALGAVEGLAVAALFAGPVELLATVKGSMPAIRQAIRTKQYGKPGHGLRQASNAWEKVFASDAVIFPDDPMIPVLKPGATRAQRKLYEAAVRESARFQKARGQQPLARGRVPEPLTTPAMRPIAGILPANVGEVGAAPVPRWTAASELKRPTAQAPAAEAAAQPVAPRDMPLTAEGRKTLEGIRDQGGEELAGRIRAIQESPHLTDKAKQERLDVLMPRDEITGEPVAPVAAATTAIKPPVAVTEAVKPAPEAPEPIPAVERPATAAGEWTVTVRDQMVVGGRRTAEPVDRNLIVRATTAAQAKRAVSDSGIDPGKIVAVERPAAAAALPPIRKTTFTQTGDVLTTRRPHDSGIGAWASDAVYDSATGQWYRLESVEIGYENYKPRRGEVIGKTIEEATEAQAAYLDQLEAKLTRRGPTETLATAPVVVAEGTPRGEGEEMLPRPERRNVIPKGERPDLNRLQRERLAKQEYEKALAEWRVKLTPEQATRVAEEETQTARRALEAEREASAREYDEWGKQVEERGAWQGNRRVGRWIEGRLQRQGIAYKRKGGEAAGESIYFEIENADGEYVGALRVSDHGQPTGGGYKGRDIVGDVRYGEADIDVNPHSGVDWKEAVDRAVSLARAEEPVAQGVEAGRAEPVLAAVATPRGEGEAIPAAKEPWEMTREEFRGVDPMGLRVNLSDKANWEAIYKRRILEEGQGGPEATHGALVESALSEGKPVPPEVLAEYPDLAAKYAPTEQGPVAAEIAVGDVITDGLVRARVTGEGTVKMGREDVPAYRAEVLTGHERGTETAIPKDQAKRVEGGEPAGVRPGEVPRPTTMPTVDLEARRRAAATRYEHQRGVQNLRDQADQTQEKINLGPRELADATGIASEERRRTEDAARQADMMFQRGGRTNAPWYRRDTAAGRAWWRKALGQENDRVKVRTDAKRAELTEELKGIQARLAEVEAVAVPPTAEEAAGAALTAPTQRPETAADRELVFEAGREKEDRRDPEARPQDRTVGGVAELLLASGSERADTAEGMRQYVQSRWWNAIASTHDRSSASDVAAAMVNDVAVQNPEIAGKEMPYSQTAETREINNRLYRMGDIAGSAQAIEEQVIEGTVRELTSGVRTGTPLWERAKRAVRAVIAPTETKRLRNDAESQERQLVDLLEGENSPLVRMVNRANFLSEAAEDIAIINPESEWPAKIAEVGKAKEAEAQSLRGQASERLTAVRDALGGPLAETAGEPYLEPVPVPPKRTPKQLASFARNVAAFVNANGNEEFIRMPSPRGNWHGNSYVQVKGEPPAGTGVPDGKTVSGGYERLVNAPWEAPRKELTPVAHLPVGGAGRGLTALRADDGTVVIVDHGLYEYVQSRQPGARPFISAEAEGRATGPVIFGDKAAKQPVAALMGMNSEMDTGAWTAIKGREAAIFANWVEKTTGPVTEMPEANPSALFAAAAEVTPKPEGEVAFRRAPTETAGQQEPPVVIAPPTTATAQPRATGKRIGRADVLRHLQEQLQVAVRVGRVKRGAVGQVRVKDELARIRSASDLPTAYHETGEILRERFVELTPTDPTMRAELGRIGEAVAGEGAGEKLRVKEGVAEYVHRYIAEPARAAREAPAFTSHFEQTLNGIKDGKRSLLDALRAVRDMHQRWESQNPVDAFRAELVSRRKAEQLSEPTRRIAGWWARVMTRAFGNRNVNLERATEMLRRAFREETGKPLSETEDPYRTLARAPMKTQRAFEEIVERGWYETDPATGKRTKVAPALLEVKKAAETEGGDFQDWQAYQTAKHGLDLIALREAEATEAGKALDWDPMPASRETLEAVVRELDSPAFREASNRWGQLTRQQRLFLEKNGFADAGFADAMQEKYPNWVPLARVFMESEVGGVGAGNRADVPSLIKRLKGSGRPIKSPIEEFQTRLRVSLDLADFFRARRQFAKAAGASRGMGGLASKVSKKMFGQNASPEQLTQMFRDLVKGLAGEGEALGEIKPEVVQKILGEPKLWSAAQGPAMKENVLPVLLENGDVELWQFHPDLIGDLTRADAFRLPDHWLLTLPKAVTAATRALNTTLRPVFIFARNTLKDIPAMLIQTPDVSPSVFVRWEKTGKPGWRPRVGDVLRGFYEVAKKTEKYREFESEGAYQGGREAIMMEPGDYASAWSEAAHQLRKASESDVHALSLWNRALSKWLAIGGALEETPRTAAALARERWALGKGKSPMEARLLGVEAARESTVPFERGGEVSKGLNRVKAFLNVQFQGPYTALRAMRRDPLGTSLRAMKVLTIPTMIAVALQHDDEDWQQLPAYRKYTGWNIPRGRDEKGEMQFAWIPFPYEWGAAFAAPVIAAADWLRTNDPDTWKDYISTAMQTAPTGEVGDVKEAASGAELAEQFFTGPFLNMMPDVLRTPVEIAVNTNWLGRDIVPHWELRQAPELQRSEYSSELARKAGEFLNYSPRKIDHILRGYGGGLTRDLVAVGDMLVEASGRGTRPVAQGGIAEALALSIRSSQTPRMVERFYTEKARLERKQSLAKAGRLTLTQREDERRKAADRLARDLSELKDGIEEIMADESLSPDERRDRAVPYLATKMRLVAHFVGEAEPAWVTKALGRGEITTGEKRPQRVKRVGTVKRATR